MTIVGYPTEDFPGPLPFALELPDGWEALHVPGSLLATRKPGGDGESQPNVIVSWQRAPANANAAVIATRLLEDVRQREGATDEEIEVATIAPDVDAALVAYGPAADGEDGLHHIGLFLVGPPTGRSRDLYQAVGTYRRSDEAGRRAVRDCLLSFTLATPTPADPVSA